MTFLRKFPIISKFSPEFHHGEILNVNGKCVIKQLSLVYTHMAKCFYVDLSETSSHGLTV